MYYSVIFVILYISILNFVYCDDYVYFSEVSVSYKFYTTPLKWSDARLQCVTDNAILAMPKNEAEAEILKNLFEVHPATALKDVKQPDHILLRFHDLFAQHEYITDDGFPLQLFYHEWMEKQPDNLNNNENCSSMHRSGNITDFPCDVPSVYICQREKYPYIDDLYHVYVNRDPAYILEPKSKKRFKLHLNPKTWAQARVICRSEGAELANIESKPEEDFLVNMFSDPEKKVHYVQYKNHALLGFHDYFDEGNYVTTKGRPLSSLDYIRWAADQPNGKTAEQCGAMYSSGALHDFPCLTPAVFFCEIKPSDKFRIKEDFLFFPEVGVWYKVYENPKNWSDARVECYNEDATLAMPKNVGEMDVLRELMINIQKSKNTTSYPYDCLWLGFHDIFEENDYVSETGYPLQYYYNQWEIGQPNNFDNEDCICMVNNGLLNDWKCMHGAPFICQKEKKKYLAELSSYHTTRDPQYLLEPEYKKRFKLHLTARTWNQARVICQAEGGQLANVANDAEKKFLIKMFADSKKNIIDADSNLFAYLGFHDQFEERKFVTIQGKPMDDEIYENLDSNAVSLNNCGSISLEDGSIYHISCISRLLYYCEILP